MASFMYMRDNLDDGYGFLELQDKIMEILLYIDSLCVAHGIEYCLMGGSALGAIRHQGFIPWDDDLDIFMDYKNYCRFLSVCDKELDTDRFHLQREDSVELPYFFSKIRMNGTTYIEQTNANHPEMHQGIFVDIMCLNNAAPSRLGKYIQYYSAGLLKAYALTKRVYETNSIKKKLELFVAKIVVRGKIKSILLWNVRRYNGTGVEQVAHLFGRAEFKHSFYKAYIFKSYKRVPFEKVLLPVPQNVEEYLQDRFGEGYMEIPSDEVRNKYPSHALYWNTSRDYKDYLTKEM